MNFQEKYKLFLNQNYDEFIKLYISEKRRLGNGCLFANLNESQKVDIYYLPIDNIPKEIKNDYIKKINCKNSDNYLYCYFFDKMDSLLLELDLVNNI